MPHCQSLYERAKIQSPQKEQVPPLRTRASIHPQVWLMQDLLQRIGKQRVDRWRPQSELVKDKEKQHLRGDKEDAGSQ
ncbi:MAG: hypothetical protein YYHSYBAR_002445 [Candidatus Fervidibacter sacchari]